MDGLLFDCVLTILKQMLMLKYQDEKLLHIGHYKVHQKWVLQKFENGNTTSEKDNKYWKGIDSFPLLWWIWIFLWVLILQQQ